MYTSIILDLDVGEILKNGYIGIAPVLWTRFRELNPTNEMHETESFRAVKGRNSYSLT
jgi:hypothetical protein